MASVGTYVGKDGKTRTRILFVDPVDGKRRTLRLGRLSKEQRATVKNMVEHLVIVKATGTPDPVAAAWLASLPEPSYARLVEVHLAEPRTPPAPEPKPEPGATSKPCLGVFLDEYIKSRNDLKPQSLVVLGHTVRNLKDFFGAERDMTTITEGDADQFKTHLMSEGLAAATVARRCGFARQFFRSARRHKLIPENPFGDMKIGSAKANKERQRFISRENTDRLLGACPDSQWRAIVILSRFAGLRCPSETLRLKWSDIDWGQGRMTVCSPKTERYAGHESRQVPLFPEVRAALMELLDQTEERGPDRIITRYPVDAPNLRQEFGRIAKRAGLSNLPKPFVNLRASCDTELTAKFPDYVRAAWLGHTPKTSEAHYLIVTPEHFEQAIQAPGDAGGSAAQKVAHKAAQQEVAVCSSVSQPVTASAILDVKRGFATTCESPVDRVGFEPT